MTVQQVIAVMLLVGAATSRAVHAECNPAPGPGATPANAAEMDEAEVLYLPTPHHVVEAMLRLAAVSRSDVVYDLGAGDGRIPIAAARAYGARGVGIELDGRMLDRARCNARAAGMERLVEFRQEDLFRADLREATVVTLFLSCRTGSASATGRPSALSRRAAIRCCSGRCLTRARP